MSIVFFFFIIKSSKATGFACDLGHNNGFASPISTARTELISEELHSGNPEGTRLFLPVGKSFASLFWNVNVLETRRMWCLSEGCTLWCGTQLEGQSTALLLKHIKISWDQYFRDQELSINHFRRKGVRRVLHPCVKSTKKRLRGGSWWAYTVRDIIL